MCLTIDLEVVDTFVDEHHEADNLKKWTLKRLRVTGMLCSGTLVVNKAHDNLTLCVGMMCIEFTSQGLRSIGFGLIYQC
jgi:hypothetical protein